MSKITTPKKESVHLRSSRTNTLTDTPTKGSQSVVLKKHIVNPIPKPLSCKICNALVRSSDLAKVLNQGLFHKFTASQDFFYTRDLNAIISKRKKPMYIRYCDDNFWDDDREHFKFYYKKEDALLLMDELKSFYSQFKDYARSFEQPFFKIVNEYIRKQRKFEYIKVFKPSPEELKTKDSTEIQGTNDKAEKADFCLMELLDQSTNAKNARNQNSTPMNRSLIEIEKNFRMLKELGENNKRMPTPNLMDNAINKKYGLISRNDSGTADDILQQLNRVILQPTVSLTDRLEQKQFSPKPDFKTLNLRNLQIGEISPQKHHMHLRTAQTDRKRKHTQFNTEESSEASADRNSLGSKWIHPMIITSMPTEPTRNSAHVQGHARNIKSNAHLRSPTYQSPNIYGLDRSGQTLPLGLKEVVDYPINIQALTKISEHPETTRNLMSFSQSRESLKKTSKDFTIRRKYLLSSGKVNPGMSVSTSLKQLYAPISNYNTLSPTKLTTHLATEERSPTYTRHSQLSPSLLSSSPEIGIKIISPGELRTALKTSSSKKSLSNKIGSPFVRVDTLPTDGTKLIYSGTLTHAKTTLTPSYKMTTAGAQTMSNNKIGKTNSMKKIYISGNFHVSETDRRLDENMINRDVKYRIQDEIPRKSNVFAVKTIQTNSSPTLKRKKL